MADLRARTSPTSDELRRLKEPVSPEALAGLARATTPLPHELLALRHRLAQPAPRGRPAWAPALAAAALSALLALGWWGLPEAPPAVVASPVVSPVVSPVMSSPEPSPLAEAPAEQAASPEPASTLAAAAPSPAPRAAPEPIGAPTPLLLSAEPAALNPSITYTGQGEARLLVRGADGAVLALDRGRIQLEVDPLGAERHLTVIAGDVTVEVMGTIFAVEREGERVSVDVTRGRVRVRDGSGARELGAGERWASHPDPADAPRIYAALTARAAAGERSDALWSELSRFAATYADSPLASEAELLRLSQQSEALPPEQVVSELDAWLARWPGAPGASEAHWLRATLLRGKLGDCQRAAPSYAVLAGGQGPRAEAAKGWLRVCAGG